jgi:hypothetical protein
MPAAKTVSVPLVRLNEYLVEVGGAIVIGYVPTALVVVAVVVGTVAPKRESFVSGDTNGSHVNEDVVKVGFTAPYCLVALLT